MGDNDQERPGRRPKVEEVQGDEIVLRNSETGLAGWWNGGPVKKIDRKRYEYLASMVNFDTGFNMSNISNVSELTSEITFFEYGPLLTLWELKEYCAKLLSKLKDLRSVDKELFFFLYTILMSSDKEQVDVSILAFKHPYCFLLKFGAIEEIKWVIHFNNRMVYNLEKKTGTLYEETFYNAALNNYSRLHDLRRVEYDTIQKYQARKTMEELTGNTAGLMGEIDGLETKIKENLKVTAKTAEKMTASQDEFNNLLGEYTVSMQKLGELSKVNAIGGDKIAKDMKIH